VWEDEVAFSTECRQLKGSARVAFDIELELRDYFGKDHVKSTVEEKKMTFTCQATTKSPITALMGIIENVFNPRAEFLTKLAVSVGETVIKRDFAGTRADQRASKAERSVVERYKLQGDGYIPGPNE
jgi:hypothetical protein